jgi:hypothetical protein
VPADCRKFSSAKNYSFQLARLRRTEPFTNRTELDFAVANEAIILTSFAVEFRNPGMDATKSDAKEAVKHCRLIRNTVRQSFNLAIK